MTIEVDLVTSAGGNIGSVSRCLDKLGVSYRLTGNDSVLPFPDGSRPIVLPGVGAFGTVMNSLQQHGFTAELRRLIEGGTPFLGICVGMQVLFDSSEEAPGVQGLGIIPGRVCKYTQGKVPQIGWNKIEPVNNHDWPEGFVYFVNSYYPRPDSDSVVLYRSDYFGPFCAAVKTENITAFQFHPEKSGEMGHGLIQRWLDDVS
ncbi:MAG: imidazole glycerol phosphate synthase subunit HisH [Cyanobacteria bacterium SZAS LIN-3]|nr:imidazole glycerol phosphate synthase subunit HisH [Cyanobacteria bacterium SZAS LIN-3]